MSDIKWTWNFDVYDESDSPTEEGYYRTIDDEGNEITDYFFGEPKMTHHGIGYWRDGTRPIIAWRYLGTADRKDEPVVRKNRTVEDEPQTDIETDVAWERVKTDCAETGWR